MESPSKTPRIGFTGSQDGMTEPQQTWLRHMLRSLRNGMAHEFHHGQCIGADEQADAIARALGYQVVLHPGFDPRRPDDRSKRANCALPSDTVWPEQPFLVRNKLIVDLTNVLVATPRTAVEEVRSGTWSTIRHGRRIAAFGLTRVVIIRPDGEIREERCT